MNNNEFDHFPSPEELINSFQVEEKPLYRPKINWLKIILTCLIAIIINIVLTIGIIHICQHFFEIKTIILVFFLLFGLILMLECLIFFGNIIICLTRIYQRYAKESIRRRCLFTPSCSEYMILAIQKYGGIRGFIKGVKRLFRCHLPNGGVDNP